MSEDIYLIEEIPVNQTQNDIEKTYTNSKKVRNRHVIVSELDGGEREYHTEAEPQEKKDCRIHEIEQQLEMAESRCNTLKGQVNYMKMLYNGMSKEGGDTERVGVKDNLKHLSVEHGASTSRKRRIRSEKRVKKSDLHKPVSKSEETWKEEPSRDTEKTMSMHYEPNQGSEVADVTAEAERSIHNIISGITHSVNRLSQLHLQMERTQHARPETSTRSKSRDAAPALREGVQSVKASLRKNVRNTTPEKPYQINPNDFAAHHEKTLTDVNNNTEEKKELQSRKRSRSVICRQLKNKNGSGISIAELKKRLRGTVVDKKSKQSPINIPSDPTKLKKKATTIVRPKLVPKNFDKQVPPEHPSTAIPVNAPENNKSDKIIELYHNSAIKLVTASEDYIGMKKRGGQNKLKKQLNIKPKIPEETETERPEIQKREEYEKPLIDTPHILAAGDCQTIHDNRIVPKHTYDGSTYFRNYELPTIASKMKQVAKNYFQNFTFRTIPFVAATSTSPSHNLGVNIQQVLSIMKGRKPLSGISPTLAYNIELAANKLGSRPFSALVSNLGSRLTNRCICPAARRVNMAQLQEQAKDVPEEANFDETGSYMPDSCSKTTYARKTDATWMLDPKHKKDQCNCFPKPGVNFNDVCSKYMNYQSHQKINPELKVKTPTLTKKPWNYNICRRSTRLASDRRFVKTFESSRRLKLDNMVLTPRTSSITTRERNLKEVLKNLHAEFSKLNDRYEDLKQTAATGNVADPEGQLKELETLEKDLLNKEDEITMVMALYKEVVALKQQIKHLKKQASQMSVTVTPYTRYKDYRDQNAAGHLTKLLRHIQQFQESFRP